MNMEDICETGPTVYSPFPRRLERLTIFGCNYKGSTFSSVQLKTLSVGPAGVELTSSRMIPVQPPVRGTLSYAIAKIASINARIVALLDFISAVQYMIHVIYH